MPPTVAPGALAGAVGKPDGGERNQSQSQAKLASSCASASVSARAAF
jgi:hypothetical protein